MCGDVDMAWAWTTVMVLSAAIACHQKHKAADTCADYPNGVCPTSDADQQQSAAKAKEETSEQEGSVANQAGSVANQAGSAMREQIASSVDFSVLDETESTLLHWAAARKRNTATLKFLLTQGVIDINKQNKFGNTALHIAVFRGDYGGVELLLQQQGVDKTLKNNSSLTAYDLAVKLKLSLIAALLAP